MSVWEALFWCALAAIAIFGDYAWEAAREAASDWLRKRRNS